MVDKAKKYVVYNSVSMRVVAGPMEASWITEVVPCDHPTTVVSTRLKSGSLNQMRTVVPQNFNNVRYDGTFSDVLVKMFCFIWLSLARTPPNEARPSPVPCLASSPEMEDCCRGVNGGAEVAVAGLLFPLDPKGAFQGRRLLAEREVDTRLQEEEEEEEEGTAGNDVCNAPPVETVLSPTRANIAQARRWDSMLFIVGVEDMALLRLFWQRGRGVK